MSSTSINRSACLQECNQVPVSNQDRLPLPALLALAMAAFITILTEALPAGLLPLMAQSLTVSEALVGQLVTIYAIGSLLAAIPLTAVTQSWRRRPLLLIAISGFAVVNAVTAVSDSYTITLVARFFAGVFAGLLWALVAGYAARMVPEHLKGRAIAIAMAGTPIALSLGIPAGTFLGAAWGWRVTFGLMSILTVILVVWVTAKVPDFPGQARGKGFALRTVFTLPGIRPILFVTLVYVLAHNILYTYIAPFLVPVGIADRIDLVLLVFGVAALLGIWIVGVLIDRRLRELVLISTTLFALAALALGLVGNVPAAVYASVAVWGLAFGGSATLFQTALAKTAGEATDVAQSMMVTVWNIAIAGGGIVGGILLETFSVSAFPWSVLVLLVAALAVTGVARSHGFPSSR
ncbi:MFS transporter [Alcaligenes aquatilis]|uniref:MFS transporter n=1 Tax=Alcaligenes aquatilis TaxID=323284 RepID=A0ABY4NCX4_9BURK|nr:MULTISPECIES: MFS transporter [Alcaligenes]UQN34905.1 MFS transporter [Alcaligenes aquatilis]HBQ90851.1 MFS transporter [Alcaligenes faecalis]